MGMLFFLATLLVVTLLWGAVPGAAADPFDIPASMPGFAGQLANGETPFSSFYAQAADSFFQDMSSASAIPGTVRPQDLLLQPQPPQLVDGAPSTVDSQQTPSSSSPSGYMPAQPRRDAFSELQGPGLTEANVQHHHSTNALRLMAPRDEEVMAAYTGGTYHVGDRLMSGRGGTGHAVLESHASTGRRQPLIMNGYRCGWCGNLYNRARDLNLHARTHNPQQPCPHPGCTSRFVSRREVSRHFDSVHQRSRSFQCETCSSAFARKDNLDRHVATVHRGQRRNPVVVHNRGPSSS